MTPPEKACPVGLQPTDSIRGAGRGTGPSGRHARALRTGLTPMVHDQASSSPEANPTAVSNDLAPAYRPNLRRLDGAYWKPLQSPTRCQRRWAACHLRDNILHTLIDVRLVAHVHNANETIGHRAMEPMPSHSFSTGRRSSSGLRHWSIGQIHANRPDIRHRKDGDVSNQIDEMRPRRYSSLVARIPDQDRIISLVGLKGDLGRRQRVAICQRPGARQYRQCVAHRKITSARRSLWYPTPLRLQPAARR